MSSPRLPAELLDYIVNFLHDTQDALRCCSLVSKSWLPRTRRHLFADIKFKTGDDLESWITMFPDPSTSPAHYARSLVISCPDEFETADAEEGGWITTFFRVTHLEVRIHVMTIDGSAISLLPLHGLSPATKSLSIVFSVVPSSQIFDFICSFPLLEDLSVIDRWSDTYDEFDMQPASGHPSSPFALTGSLELDLGIAMNPIVVRLLSLPNSLHCRKLHVTLNYGEDVPLTSALVEKCYLTLETLWVECDLWGELPSTTIDLSKAVILKDVAFSCELDPRWVAMSLRTTTHNHRNLQRITLDAPSVLYGNPNPDPVDPSGVQQAIGGSTYQGWMELDRILVQLWESHSVHLKVLYSVPRGMAAMKARGFMENLLPEVTKRGVVDLAEGRHPWRIR